MSVAATRRVARTPRAQSVRGLGATQLGGTINRRGSQRGNPQGAWIQGSGLNNVLVAECRTTPEARNIHVRRERHAPPRCSC
jgi:hypothetical protein